MCRFIVYNGSREILMSKLVTEPKHALLRQTFDARLRLEGRTGVANNVDGYGLAWYVDRKYGHEPAVYKSTAPAYSDPNLPALASKTASHLIFAHLRSSTVGSTCIENCHPFSFGSLIFMQNGGIAPWKHIQRHLMVRVADKWFLQVKGGTDSEWIFILFLDTLERMGHDPANEELQKRGFGPSVLRQATFKTIARINELIDAIPRSLVEAEKIDTRTLINVAITDGHTVICTRYVGSKTEQAASLYYSSGTTWDQHHSPGQIDGDFLMERSDKAADVVLVSSEPISFERENWVNVPTNTILTIHNKTVLLYPIIDKYYTNQHNSHRSTAFVNAMGLAANENKHASEKRSSCIEAELQRKLLAVSLEAKKAAAAPIRHRSLSPCGAPLSSAVHPRTPLSQMESVLAGPTALTILEPAGPAVAVTLPNVLSDDAAVSPALAAASITASTSTSTSSPPSVASPSSDIRNVTEPQPSMLSHTSKKGNIKKKRASISTSLPGRPDLAFAVVKDETMSKSVFDDVNGLTPASKLEAEKRHRSLSQYSAQGHVTR